MGSVRWIDEHFPVQAVTTSSLPLWAYGFVGAAILASVILLFAGRRIRPGHATAALGFVAVLYAVASLAVQKLPPPVAVGVIIFAFALMVAEIRAISRDANERESKHAKLVEDIGGIAVTLTRLNLIERELKAVKGNPLKSRALTVATEILRYVADRQAEDPASKVPIWNMSVDFGENLRRSSEHSAAVSNFAYTASQGYWTRFSHEVPTVIDELYDAGVDVSSILQISTPITLLDMRIFADKLYLLAMSMSDE